MNGGHQLSLTRQCELLDVNRSSLYYRPRETSGEDEELMSLIDRIYLEYPFKGSRRVVYALRDRHGIRVNRKRVRRLMGLMGLCALYPRRRTTVRDAGHKVYPYLLGGVKISRPDQVWAADITYVPMDRGFVYLVAVMDWHSRKVLSWKVSNTMDVSFCVEALEEALGRYGRPGIFNTDQGSQFTSEAFTEVLKENDIRISMDGKGSWRDNVFVERLWRSLKYEEVHLKAYESVGMAKAEIGKWIEFYNSVRRHSGLGGLTPDQVYYSSEDGRTKAA